MGSITNTSGVLHEPSGRIIGRDKIRWDCGDRLDRALPPEQPLGEIVSGHREVLRHVAEDTGERPDPQWRVAWNGDVMLAAFGGGQAEVTSRLAGHPVAEVRKHLREVVTGDVPRKPQAVMTSSRTK